MSAVLWSYYYYTTLVEPPAAYRILLNAASPYTAVSKAWISQTTAASLNVKATLLQIPAGAVLHIQDHQYSDHWVECLTTGAVIDKGTYVEVPIAWDSNGLNLYNGSIAEVLFVSSIDLTTPPPSTTEPPTAPPFSRVTLPPLWTVEDAKIHLHITGTAHDADIQQKLDTAQEAILSYLAVAADPAWAAETAPKAVTHAIHLLTAYYYDADRGDKPETPSPWPKIYDLLGAYRDPTVK